MFHDLNMTKQISLIVVILVIIGMGIFLLSGNRAPQAPTAPAVNAPTPTEQPASQPPRPAPPTASGPVNLPLPATSAATPSTSLGQASQPTTPPASEPIIKEFTITAKRFTWDPAQITVKLNDRVRLKVTSVDVTHGISIPQFNVSEVLPPNETKTIEFIADKQGTFRFFCSVYCGSGHGDMKGSLVVQ